MPSCPEIRRPNSNAETQRSQRNAEKQETADCRMQETPNLSAFLCDLCVFALIPGFGLSAFALRSSDCEQSTQPASP
jgi:hypothetical protein